MVQVVDILSTENELFRTYLFYCCILVLKVLVMVPLTAMQRIKHMAVINPEDSKMFNVPIKIDENVERVRRAHLNDLENIPIFFVASFAYILTNPAVATATILFKIFTMARIIHTLVYAVCVIPQPARGLTFGAGFFVTIYMAVQGIVHFM